MLSTLTDKFEQSLGDIDSGDPNRVSEMVDIILSNAQQAGVSDVHLLPDESGLNMLWRIDGVLQTVATFPKSVSSNVVSRLKVMSELLTYRVDIPQEGRIHQPDSTGIEMRVSTFPTLYGEKAVVRLFVASGQYRYLNELGFSADLEGNLRQLLLRNGGIILVTGPAGSGKTTTIYACLRELVNKFGEQKSLVTLEDPIEAVVPGVAQSQINPNAEFTYGTGLRSLMRQDPEVIVVGEIRDRETAEIVFQASLTGHLVMTTFHAGSAAGAISRLSDMDIEPYLLRSGILGIVSQRLVRTLCECSAPIQDDSEKLGLNVQQAWNPVGCDNCGGTGYRGRLVLAELLLPDLKELGRAILTRGDATEIEELAIQSGMETCMNAACRAIESNKTSPAEVRRVLGF